jgi:hypothetical protein
MDQHYTLTNVSNDPSRARRVIGTRPVKKQDIRIGGRRIRPGRKVVISPAVIERFFAILLKQEKEGTLSASFRRSGSDIAFQLAAGYDALPHKKDDAAVEAPPEPVKVEEPPEPEKVVSAEVGAMTAETTAGPDGEFGTDDDETTIVPTASMTEAEPGTIAEQAAYDNAVAMGAVKKLPTKSQISKASKDELAGMLAEFDLEAEKNTKTAMQDTLRHYISAEGGDE